MTALADILARRISASGPISLADYMAECLLHPEHGYYSTRDPFGAAGDFTTAPEISQMFGELLGLCLAQSWLDQGAPTPFLLAEIGPGRGTLMADILRTTARVPGFHAAMQVWLVEASTRLRAVQRDRLAGQDVAWAAHVSALPDMPLFLVANEFFDALPIRQFHRAAGDSWHEVQVALGPEGGLAPGLAMPANYALLRHRLADTVEGDIVEHCPALPGMAEEIAGRIAARGGAALIVDYGGWHSRGDTFQALRGHACEDPFANPGEADLTAHVDFEALALAGTRAGAAVTPMVPQGVFLQRLGIAARAEALAAHLGGAALEAHLAAYRRLTAPPEMGSLFKAIAYYPVAAPAPPGLWP